MARKNNEDKSIASAAAEQVRETVEFDVWWASRQSQIPAHHHKEIIKADMRGRGVSMKETMQDFDEALKKYGIQLA